MRRPITAIRRWWRRLTGRFSDPNVPHGPRTRVRDAGYRHSCALLGFGAVAWLFKLALSSTLEKAGFPFDHAGRIAAHLATVLLASVMAPATCRYLAAVWAEHLRGLKGATPQERARARHPFIAGQWLAYLSLVTLLLNTPAVMLPFGAPMIAASELLVRACLGYLSAVAILLCICKFYLKELRGVSKLTHISHLAARGALLLFLAAFCWLTGILCGMSAFASLALTVASRFSLPWQSVLRLNPDTCLLHFPISTPRTWATFVQDGSFTWPANEAWLERFLGNAVLNAGGGFSTTLFSPLFTLSQSPGFLLFSAIVACTWFAASYKCLELFLQHVWKALLLFCLYEHYGRQDRRLDDDAWEEFKQRADKLASRLNEESLEELELLFLEVRRVLYAPFVAAPLWWAFGAISFIASFVPGASFLIAVFGWSLVIVLALLMYDAQSFDCKCNPDPESWDCHMEYFRDLAKRLKAKAWRAWAFIKSIFW